MPFCMECGHKTEPDLIFCTNCGSKLQDIGKLNLKKKYMLTIEKKMIHAGFAIKKDIHCLNYNIDLLAEKDLWDYLILLTKMTRYIPITTINNVTLESFQNYSTGITNFLIKNRNSIIPRGFGAALQIFPVIMAENIDKNVIAWLEKSVATKHFAAIEFPVLVSTQDFKIFYSKKTPLYGAIFYPGIRNFVDTVFNLYKNT